jgi:cyclin-dependent kinase 2
MINHAPLFPGDSEIDQLYRIFRVLGTPDDDVWPAVSSLPDYKPQFPQWKAKAWKDVCPNLDRDGIDLLISLLHYAPHKRVSARQACEHRFFDDYAPARGGGGGGGGGGSSPEAGSSPASQPSSKRSSGGETETDAAGEETE